MNSSEEDRVRTSLSAAFVEESPDAVEVFPAGAIGDDEQVDVRLDSPRLTAGPEP
jgi:hypothetical protein